MGHHEIIGLAGAFIFFVGVTIYAVTPENRETPKHAIVLNCIGGLMVIYSFIVMAAKG